MPRKALSFEERIQLHVFFSPDGCWYWTAASDKDGYGCTAYCGKSEKAHRASYEFFNKTKVPSDINVCHSCDNTLCVNPDHLFLGTIQDNIADRHSKGRTAVGSNSGPAKLTESEVLIIRLGLSKGDSQVSLANRFNVDPSTISLIALRKKWKHI